jgi:uncharacterized protein (TIGR02466 family)
MGMVNASNMPVTKHFPTQILTDQVGTPALNKQLLREVKDLMELDGAGRAWSKDNYKNGFTSYASANELQKFSPTFEKLEKLIDQRVKKYARALDFDLGGAKLRMTTCWVNVMKNNTHHSLHLHPLSVISGTYYVNVPAGAPAIKFEDPRASRFMNSPPRKNTHLQVPARPGTLVLFESWLRHEVPLHSGKIPRVSISFNYEWA